MRWAEGQALRAAAGVVAVSRFTAARTTAPVRLARQPVGCIPNGIDLDPLYARPPPHTEDPDTILYFGTLVRKKGVLDLPAILSAPCWQCPSPRARLRDHWARCARPAKRRGFYLGICCAPGFPTPSDGSGRIYRVRNPINKCKQQLRKRLFACSPLTLKPYHWHGWKRWPAAKPLVAYDIGWAGEIIVPGDHRASLVPAGDTTAALATGIGGDFLADPADAARDWGPPGGPRG